MLGMILKHLFLEQKQYSGGYTTFQPNFQSIAPFSKKRRNLLLCARSTPKVWPIDNQQTNQEVHITTRKKVVNFKACKKHKKSTQNPSWYFHRPNRTIDLLLICANNPSNTPPPGGLEFPPKYNPPSGERLIGTTSAAQDGKNQ